MDVLGPRNDDIASADEIGGDDDARDLDLTPRTPPRGRTGGTGQRRWPWFVVLVVIVVGIGFVISKAISDASLFFYNADEAVAKRSELADTRFRLQGSVEAGTTVRTADGVAFKVAFNGVEVPVEHKGDPPDMFKDQIPVVLEGRWGELDGQPVFDSDYMLVKHGNEYEEENPDRIREAEQGGSEPVTQPAASP
jgi:cytochrome c-type biogenesis protein CcmE